MNVSEVNTGEGVWQVFLCFLGVGEHGMLDISTLGNFSISLGNISLHKVIVVYVVIKK